VPAAHVAVVRLLGLEVLGTEVLALVIVEPFDLFSRHLGTSEKSSPSTILLDLSEEDIAALETRTEGWIAGLQLAAISMQGHKDTTSFIRSFTGSHHFVLDYLVEEVLQQQSESVQVFLLRTSILDHLCGPLCDAVLLDPSASGQEILEYIERSNLFLVPLDDERR